MLYIVRVLLLVLVLGCFQGCRTVMMNPFIPNND
jgi:hypothetical protein